MFSINTASLIISISLIKSVTPAEATLTFYSNPQNGLHANPSFPSIVNDKKRSLLMLPWSMLVVWPAREKVGNRIKISKNHWNDNQALTLKALPSVSLHLPPVGLLRMFLQLLQATMVWAWLKTTAVSLQPPHFTSIK